MKNIKEEFIKLEEFKQSIEYKIKKLTQMETFDKLGKELRDKFLFEYTIVLGEINCFIEEEANSERDKFSYITNE